MKNYGPSDSIRGPREPALIGTRSRKWCWARKKALGQTPPERAGFQPVGAVNCAIDANGGRR